MQVSCQLIHRVLYQGRNSGAGTINASMDTKMKQDPLPFTSTLYVGRDECSIEKSSVGHWNKKKSMDTKQVQSGGKGVK